MAPPCRFLLLNIVERNHAFLLALYQFGSFDAQMMINVSPRLNGRSYNRGNGVCVCGQGGVGGWGVRGGITECL